MPSGDRPKMFSRSAAGTVESRAASAITVRSRRRQSDERRAQHRQPGHAIERRLQRARQRLQVAHHRHIGQGFEIHADERHAARCECRADRAQVRHARRPALPRSRPAGCGPARRSDCAAASASSRGPQSASTRYSVRLAFEVRARGDAGKVTHRAAPHVVDVGEHAREHFVAPVHQRRRRAEIAPQFQRLQSHARRARRRARSRIGPPRRCESRRWTASDRRPGTACGRRLPTSPASASATGRTGRARCPGIRRRGCALMRVPSRSASGVGDESSVSAWRAAPATSG